MTTSEIGDRVSTLMHGFWEEMHGEWDDDVEEALIRKMMEESESNLTWAHRVMWFCIVVGLVLLLVLLLR